MEKSATFIIEKYFILVFSETDPLHFTLYTYFFADSHRRAQDLNF